MPLPLEEAILRSVVSFIHFQMSGAEMKFTSFLTYLRPFSMYKYDVPNFECFVTWDSCTLMNPIEALY